VATRRHAAARGADSGHALLLVNALRLREGAHGLGWRAYREDLVGFAIGWAVVIGLVIATGVFLST
jgi:hypothetical protein